jgi:hypothetical protein
MTLLFRLAEWHALAKLRLHTEPTLTCMESVTVILGRELRHFCSVTCAAFTTVELPKEVAARGRRESRKKAKVVAAEGSEADIQPPTAQQEQETTRTKKKKKNLNLSTYKVHALGDYARTIRMHGTTDSYSTQTVRSFGHVRYKAHKPIIGRT